MVLFLQDKKDVVEIPVYSDVSSDSEGDGNPKRQRPNETTNTGNGHSSEKQTAGHGNSGAKERKKQQSKSSKSAENGSKAVKQQQQESDSDTEWGINANNICFERPFVSRKRNLVKKNSIFEIKPSKINGDDWTRLSRNDQSSNASQLYYPSYFNRDILNSLKNIGNKADKWMKQMADCKNNIEKVQLAIQ
jgi:hypothetical protein